ncbi:MAG: Fic family protein [Micropruina sp.]
MPDHYCYPGSHVLVNIHGYADPELWKAAERRVVRTHLADLVEHPVAGGFDLAHLQAIHGALVDGFYSWGGQLRTTDTGPGGTGIAHCRPEFIRAETDRVFGTLTEADYLRGRDRDAFSRGLAWTWGELTVIHPFRDVNTRTQFTLLQSAGLACRLADRLDDDRPLPVRICPYCRDRQ